MHAQLLNFLLNLLLLNFLAPFVALTLKLQHTLSWVQKALFVVTLTGLAWVLHVSYINY